MAGLSVDSDAVTLFGQQFAEVCAGLSAATQPNALSNEEAGGPEVVEALDRFRAHWSQERVKLQQSLDALSRTIRDAADDYARSDHVIASAATDNDHQSRSIDG